jgi:hypothetical protein
VNSLADGFQVAAIAGFDPSSGEQDFRGVIRRQGIEPLVERAPALLVLIDINPHW